MLYALWLGGPMVCCYGRFLPSEAIRIRLYLLRSCLNFYARDIAWIAHLMHHSKCLFYNCLKTLFNYFNYFQKIVFCKKYVYESHPSLHNLKIVGQVAWKLFKPYDTNDFFFYNFHATYPTIFIFQATYPTKCFILL